MAVPNKINRTALPKATQTRQIPTIKAMPKKSSAMVAAHPEMGSSKVARRSSLSLYSA